MAGDGGWYIVGRLLVSSMDKGMVRGTLVPQMRVAQTAGCAVAHALLERVYWVDMAGKTVVVGLVG